MGNKKKICGLAYHYEKSQFQYSELLFDKPGSYKYDTQRIYAMVPTEFLGRKLDIDIIKDDGKGNKVRTLVCKIRGRGQIFVSGEIPKEE